MAVQVEDPRRAQFAGSDAVADTFVDSSNPHTTDNVSSAQAMMPDDRATNHHTCEFTA